MPIDYLNNDRSHDWINLQTKIYTFFDKISTFSKSSLFRVHFLFPPFFQKLHFCKISTFSKSPLFSKIQSFKTPFIQNLHFYKISTFSKTPLLQDLNFFKISAFLNILEGKTNLFCQNLHCSWNLKIQEYSWIFFWSLNLKYPHLSLLEIRKGRKGVVKSSINLQKMIYNWPREGRGRGHYHIHGPRTVLSSKMGRKLNFCYDVII